MSRRPRWSEDLEAYQEYLKFCDVNTADAKDLGFRLELNEDRWARRIPLESLDIRMDVTEHTPIDHAWVLGMTCGDRFVDLTYHERTFLYMIYHCGSVREASETMRMTKSTAYRVLREIRIKTGYKISNCPTCNRLLVPKAGGPTGKKRLADLAEEDCMDCVLIDETAW